MSLLLEQKLIVFHAPLADLENLHPQLSTHYSCLEWISSVAIKEMDACVLSQLET